MKASIHYTQRVEVDFATLLNDPTLVIRNLPRVDKVYDHGAEGYYVISTPYVFHGALKVVGRGHVNIEVIDGEIHWLPCAEEHETCNGRISGIAKATPDGKTFVDGVVEIEHPFINQVTWIAMQPLVARLGLKFMEEFAANLIDPAYENTILPESAMP